MNALSHVTTVCAVKLGHSYNGVPKWNVNCLLCLALRLARSMSEVLVTVSDEGQKRDEFLNCLKLKRMIT